MIIFTPQILAGGVFLLPQLSMHMSIQILSWPLLRNYTWQLFLIFRFDQSYMEPVYCWVILTFWLSSLETMTFTLLKNYKWQQLHIFRAYQPAIGPVHCRDNLTLWPFTLTFMTITMEIMSSPLLRNYNDNFFIFSGHINLTWDLCSVESFRLFDLCSWSSDLWLSECE